MGESIELNSLRQMLCRDLDNFCQECFRGYRYASVQNPPNVIRVGRAASAKVFFVFDKPNNNDSLRRSPLVPITIFDSRPGLRSPSHRNLILLLDALKIPHDTDGDELNSDFMHITNAVKCDKRADTGKTGRVEISDRQVRMCVSRFFLRELDAIRPAALVFFGVLSQRYAMGRSTRLWECEKVEIADRRYWVMRVPHTSPTSFNTHGGRGNRYVEPFAELRRRAGI